MLDVAYAKQDRGLIDFSYVYPLGLGLGPVAVGWITQACKICLTELGANVDAAKSTGWTALHWAAQNNSQPIVDALLSAGAAVDRRADFDEHGGCTPLHLAAQLGHVDVARRLIEAGADVDAVKSHGIVHRISTVHLAASAGHPDTVRLLLDHANDPLAARPRQGPIGCLTTPRIHWLIDHDKDPLAARPCQGSLG